jgi:hypothetical protein
VTLTVTDNQGATGSVSHDVVVSEPGTVTPLAADGFSRTVSGGWGSADVGGPWSVSGSTSRLSVNGSAGVFSLSPGWTLGSWLAGVSSTSTDVMATLSMDQVPDGSGAWVHVQGRRVSATQYYGARVRVYPDGSVQLHATAGNGSPIAGGVVSGLTFAAGDQLRVRVQVDGTSPTTIRAKVWKVGDVEPTAWQVQTTDATAGLQVAGGIGFLAYLTGSATTNPLTLTIDDLTATTVG